jgi:high-affinity nickel permease
MASILFLGFFIGMHHTLEADHVAAVASISSDESAVRRIVKHGVVWGNWTLQGMVGLGTVIP